APFARITSVPDVFVAHPLIQLALRLFLFEAVTLLYNTNEFTALAAGARKVVVRQIAPALLHLAFKLVPIAFDLLPVHRTSLRSVPQCGVNVPENSPGAMVRVTRSP